MGKFQIYPENRRGSFFNAPLLGSMIILITITTGGLILSENSKQLSTAESMQFQSTSSFIPKVIAADIFNVYMQTKLQAILDDPRFAETGAGATTNRLGARLRDSLNNAISNMPLMYSDSLGAIECRKSDAIELRSDTLPIYYTTDGDPIQITGVGVSNVRIINSDKTIIVRPILMGFAMSCYTTDPPMKVTIRLRSKKYYLDGSKMCENFCDNQNPYCCSGVDDPPEKCNKEVPGVGRWFGCTFFTG